jgi:hypothetical protein
MSGAADLEAVDHAEALSSALTGVANQHAIDAAASGSRKPRKNIAMEHSYSVTCWSSSV